MENETGDFSARLADKHALAALEAAGREDWARSVAHYRVAGAAGPHVAENWINLSTALQRVGHLDGAEQTARQGVAMKPALAAGWNMLGLIAIDRERFEEARTHLSRALELEPGNAQTRMNMGIAYHKAGRDNEALTSLAHALQLDPSLVPAHYNLGALHHKRGDHTKAIDQYRKAIHLRPKDAQSHFNLALAYFMTGRFGEAWTEYAWRAQRREHAAILRNEGRRRVAIHAEQGLGDNLFFLRFAPALHEEGKVLEFVGDPRLRSMLARTGLFSLVAARLDELPKGDRDVVLAGDLPSMGVLSDTPPPLQLSADSHRTAVARALLASHGPKPHIALAWRAGEPKSGRIENLFKEIPLDMLGAALKGVRATWVSVQRDPKPGETEALSKAIGAPVHDLSAVNTDLEEALALLAVVDDYVGVSSTLIHLRAGVRGPMRIVVPFPHEWRWMESGETSPWFPRAKLYRQGRDRDWHDAMSRLTRDLTAARS